MTQKVGDISLTSNDSAGPACRLITSVLTKQLPLFVWNNNRQCRRVSVRLRPWYSTLAMRSPDVAHTMRQSGQLLDCSISMIQLSATAAVGRRSHAAMSQRFGVRGSQRRSRVPPIDRSANEVLRLSLTERRSFSGNSCCSWIATNDSVSCRRSVHGLFTKRRSHLHIHYYQLLADRKILRDSVLLTTSITWRLIF